MANKYKSLFTGNLYLTDALIPKAFSTEATDNNNKKKNTQKKRINFLSGIRSKNRNEMGQKQQFIRNKRYEKFFKIFNSFFKRFKR